MSKPYKLALHIFRRDLRLHDNTALIEALRSSEQVIPAFIFDKRQIEKNDFKSDHALSFMATSLAELNNSLKQKGSQLYCFYGIAEHVIDQLLSAHSIDAIYINRDYTPFSLKRDEKIKRHCDKHHIAFHCFADALLNEPEDVHKDNGAPYTVFTPFFKRASKIAVREPRKNAYRHYYQQPIAEAENSSLAKLQKLNFPNLLTHGGRKEGLALLKKALDLQRYNDTRNIPAEYGTSRLSAHNKFGTVSIREVYHLLATNLGKDSALISELYWRDFFSHIAYHFPRVFGHAFYEKYDNLTWSRDKKHYRAWCEGRTGFPIVDAGMRELNATGYMHNRVRMIVASFLTKDLHINWQWGEKHFAQKLIDYDPSVNNGNWQWAASTGCDAQPYFRIFNPWLQQAKFDPDCLYIKHWIPELAHLLPKEIHSIYKGKQKLMTNYPEPIISHQIESLKAKNMYKKNP